MDSIDLDHAKKYKTKLRTDALAQNCQTGISTNQFFKNSYELHMKNGPLNLITKKIVMTIVLSVKQNLIF